MSSTRISDHLTLGELTKSTTAFRRGINNDPSEQVIGNLRKLASNLFEPLRARWEESPDHATSSTTNYQRNLVR